MPVCWLTPRRDPRGRHVRRFLVKLLMGVTKWRKEYSRLLLMTFLLLQLLSVSPPLFCVLPFSILDTISVFLFALL